MWITLKGSERDVVKHMELGGNWFDSGSEMQTSVFLSPDGGKALTCR